MSVARLTPQTWWRFGLVALAAVVLSEGLGRLGVLTDFRALMLGAAACFALAALSLNVIFGYAGQLSLGHVALMGFGAFVGAKLTAPLELRLSFGPSLAIAAVLTASVGFLLGLPALRLRGLYLAIVTLAFQYVMWQSVFRSRPLSTGSGGVRFPRPWIGTYEFRTNASYLAVVLVVVIVVWLADTNLTETKVGRALQAIRADEEVAASFGIDVTGYKLLAFTFSGGVAGVAGFLYGHLLGFVSNDSFPLLQSLVLVILVVVGGAGSRPGIAVAGAFFGLFPVLLDNTIGRETAINWGTVIGGLLLLVTVVRNPGGLAASLRDELRERRHRRAGPEVETEDPVQVSFPHPPAPVSGAVTGGQPVLEAKNVTVDFGGVRAVDDASIVVPRGRIVGLIGPNGAGKTTLFNAIGGVVPPRSGRFVLAGEDVTNLPTHARARKGIGRTFQLVGLARDRSVVENLLLAQHQLATYTAAEAIAGIGRAPAKEAELRARAADALEALGFERYADVPVRDLSGGQQRIVEMACALLTAPELLMLDEPSAGMAPAAVESLGERLAELRDDAGRTILLIEHNIPLVLDVCDDVYVMSEGGVIAHGAPRDVVAIDAVVEAYLGRVEVGT